MTWFLSDCDLVSVCIYTKNHIGFIQNHSSISKFLLETCKWEKENCCFKTAEKKYLISFNIFYFTYTFPFLHSQCICLVSISKKSPPNWTIRFRNICCRSYSYYSITLHPFSNFFYIFFSWNSNISTHTKYLHSLTSHLLIHHQTPKPHFISFLNFTYFHTALTFSESWQSWK